MRQRLAIVGLALAGTTCAAARPACAAEAACFLGNTLPQGTYRADTFTLGIPKELAGVQAKFAEAVAKKQEWFQAYLARLNLKPGEPLPYDEQMGLTRQEYEALAKAYANPKILPLGAIQVEVACSDGSIRFSAKAPNDFLSQVRISANGVLTGPVNLRCSPETVKSRHAKFGVWSGTTWSFESGDEAQGSVRHFELSIGKLDDSGRLLLFFDHSMIENRKPLANNRFLAWLTRTDPESAHTLR